MDKSVMKTITIVINDGGVVSEVLASKELADDITVEVIDFCTDDDDEYDDAIIAYNKVVENKDFVSVY